MSKLWLIGLAASAAWTSAATAQGAPPPPPPPPMAHGAHAPGHGATVMHGGGHRVRPPRVPGGGHRVMPPRMPGGGMKGFHRFGRGHIIPPHFRGGQFIVHDWRMFGFPAPMAGGHWIRHHDDALLIDRDGRVVDGRYGWDWDRRGDRMAHDDDRYDDRYDDGDYDREDYGRDEDWDGDARDGHHGKGDRNVRVYRHGGPAMGDCRRRCAPVHHVPAPPQPHPGYGYGYGYGYGCGCGPVVITETTTTTPTIVETRTYYETVIERAAPRRHYSKPVRRYSKPVVRRSVKAAPRPGERG